MLKKEYKTFSIILIIITNLIFFSCGIKGSSLESSLEKKQKFYNKILKSQPENAHLELVVSNQELYLSAKKDIPKFSHIITPSQKHIFTGCKIIFIKKQYIFSITYLCFKAIFHFF